VPKGGYAVQIEFLEPAAPRSSPWSDPCAARPRIAVLPFANLSADLQQEFFADGVTEDLTTDLSKLSGLFVVSRHSAFAYRNSALRVEQIAAELGARYVLAGSVRRAGQTLRITAQLSDAERGHQLWAERYDRSLAEVFAVQDSVTRRIVRALAVRLSPIEDARIGVEATADLEAYDLLQRAVARYWDLSPAALADAHEWLRRSIAHDADYATAHAWLARVLIAQYAAFLGPDPDVALPQALAHAVTAAELDPLLPIAHTMSCYALLWTRRAAEAIRAGQRGIELDPNSADAHAHLSYALSANGQGEEALRIVEAALLLNPRPSAPYLVMQGQALVALGRFDDAIAVFRHAVMLSPAFRPARTSLAINYARLGRFTEAREQVDALTAAAGGKALRLRNVYTDAQLRQGYAEAARSIGLAAPC
jgi:adenylate cyclase